jgi:hypothetical protein
MEDRNTPKPNTTVDPTRDAQGNLIDNRTRDTQGNLIDNRTRDAQGNLVDRTAPDSPVFDRTARDSAAFDRTAPDSARLSKTAPGPITPPKAKNPNAYTDANRKCSTVIDRKTKATCDLYPGDHEWTEPDKPDRIDNESDSQYLARIAMDKAYQDKRNEAQFTRGKPHRTDLSSCQGYTDDETREADV